MERVAMLPEPEGQVYHVGSKVLVAGEGEAVVLYTGAHAYQTSVEDYCVEIIATGERGWADIHILSLA